MVSIFCNGCGFPSSEDARFCQRCGAPLSVTSSSLSVTPHYAGFWIRVLASIIDTFFLFAALFPLRFAVSSAITWFGVTLNFPVQEIFLVRRVVRIAAGLVIGWAYKAGMESSHHQATLGKLAMRLKVTDLEGRRISFSRATRRYLAKFLSTLSLFIGYLMVAFDEQKQGLHDRITGTFVLYRRSSP